MSIEVGLLIAIAGIVISFASFMGNRAKNHKSDGEEIAEVRSVLSYIRRGIDDIKIDLKANEKNINSLAERVTRVEESVKQAHKRLDAIDGKKEN